MRTREFGLLLFWLILLFVGMMLSFFHCHAESLPDSPKPQHHITRSILDASLVTSEIAAASIKFDNTTFKPASSYRTTGLKQDYYWHASFNASGLAESIAVIGGEYLLEKTGHRRIARIVALSYVGVISAYDYHQYKDASTNRDRR